jgi:prepilin-type N-terminal cleavage/methylation domain-containing protein
MGEIDMSNQKAFTIFELAITLTILGILTLLASGLLNIGIKSYQHFISRSVMIREAQNTMILLHKKIPMSVPKNIIRANSRRFRFLTAEGEDVDIQYRSNNGILRYRIVGVHGWKTILNNIAGNSFEFNYLKGDSTSWSSIDEIRRVAVKFDLNLNGEQSSYEDHFYIRN